MAPITHGGPPCPDCLEDCPMCTGCEDCCECWECFEMTDGAAPGRPMETLTIGAEFL